MAKYPRVWRREGESLESYQKRLEEAYNEILQTEEGQKIAKEFEEQIYKAYNNMRKEKLTKRRNKMEKKIIELTNVEGQGWDCLICCKNDASTELKINRPQYDDSVITFRVCNECLAKMQKDIEARQ